MTILQNYSTEFQEFEFQPLPVLKKVRTGVNVRLNNVQNKNKWYIFCKGNPAISISNNLGITLLGAAIKKRPSSRQQGEFYGFETMKK